MQAFLKAAALFKAAYLSYECFIQETKYEPERLRASPRETEDSRTLIMASESGEEGKTARQRKQAATISSILLASEFLFLLCRNSAASFPKTEK